MFESEWWLGRRFEFADKSAPDMTVVGGKPKEGKLRVHSTDGTRAWLPWAELMAAVQMGILIESSKPPFVFDREHDLQRELYREFKKRGVLSVMRKTRAGDRILVRVK